MPFFVGLSDESLKIIASEGIDEKVLALPTKTIETLMSQQCNSREVVHQLRDCLKLDSLENRNPQTKRLIRYLANKAKQSDRPDVVRELREFTPAGSIGEFVAVVL